METVANDLRDRVAVITGGARGMGRAYVRAFLSAGAKVVATDRSWSGADEFREELKSNDKNVLIADMDVTEDAQIDQTYQATLSFLGTRERPALTSRTGRVWKLEERRDLFRWYPST
jgi:NAD(P)-dependent dehydrogenase (short-subunit alcohol dehydrogenase family)